MERIKKSKKPRKLSSLEKIQLAIVNVILLTMIPVVVISFIDGLWNILFMAFLIVFFSFLPYFLHRRYDVNFPMEFQFLLTIFLYAAFFLGEVSSFYAKFWWWDLALHAGAGIAFGFLSFLILYSLYVSGRLKTSAVVIAVFSFAFAVAAGTMWEIFEFVVDNVIGSNLQKSGLLDTMTDNIVNALGALFVSVLAYFYIEKQSRGYGIFDHFVTKFLKANPRFKNQTKLK